MILHGKWECRNGHVNEPEAGEYSFFKCASCGMARWPRLWWAAGGGAVFIIFIVFIAGIIWPDPEKTYGGKCRKYILGVEGKVGEITDGEERSLEKLGKRLGFSGPEMERLCVAVKKTILKEKKEEYRLKPPGKNEITADEQKKIVLLAEIMGILAEEEHVAGKGIMKGKLADAKSLLERGRYKEAEVLLSGLANIRGASSMLNGIKAPLNVELGFQHQNPGESPSAIVDVNSEELTGLTLTHRDNYRLFCSTSDRSFLYIFQIDEAGKVFRIFPDPVYNIEENPVHPSVRYQIPSKGDEWYYLEELSVGQKTTEETIYILASRWPARDLDEAYGAVYRSTSEIERKNALGYLRERLLSRKDFARQGIFFQEFVFIHRR
ncbi:MAG: DUF4384 domain-containing protein [Pirellulales bacterium]|nr:DUF4384 domain-containing protein [Pirellulales bacterium]